MRLIGNVALVTGAGRGIGLAIAKALADGGLKIGALDRDAELAATANRQINDIGGQSVALTADVTDQAAVDAAVADLVQAVGPVDIVVNNAAEPAEFVAFHKTDLEVQRKELATFTGTLNCTRAVIPSMIERCIGRVINISSIGGRHGVPGRTIYAGAKGGIDAFTLALAHEVGQYGITVNAISPGATESPRFKARSKAIRDSHQRLIAIRRFGEPEDIANAVLFFAQESSDYITGAILDADGGFCGYEPSRDS